MKHLLLLTQLDRKLAPLSNVTVPSQGWVRCIRNALGMTAQQLAKRCGYSTSRVLIIERDEMHGNLTLSTLHKVAANLGCRLVYGFVPETSLVETVDKRAVELAKHKLATISHSMELEEQAIGTEDQRLQLVLIKQELLNGSLKRLWNDPI
jgi:predicted DNA-binding mobile mystery protein A